MNLHFNKYKIIIFAAFVLLIWGIALGCAYMYRQMYYFFKIFTKW